MNSGNTLGQPINPKPIGQISDVSTGEVDVIANTSEKILGVLEEQDRGIVNKSVKQLNILLHRLGLEVDGILDKIDYDYNVDNYNMRISQNKELFELTLKILLRDNKGLNDILEKILLEFEGYNNALFLRQQIIEEYFLDLVYMSMENALLEDYDETIQAREHIILISQNMIEAFINNPQQLESFVNINRNNKILSFIFIRSDISGLSNDQFELLFSSYREIRVVDMKAFRFDLLSLEQVEIISKYITNIKGLDISQSFFTDLPIDYIRTMCGSFNNLTYLNFENNSLLHADLENIKVIFMNLNKLKNISFSGTHLDNITDELIDATFSNLGNLDYINLTHCKLSDLDNNLLIRLFGHLRNVKCIIAYNNILEVEQQQIIKDLCPNSSITF